MPAAKTTFIKVAVQFSAYPDASGWLIIRPGATRISAPLEVSENRHLVKFETFNCNPMIDQ
jgi:hypothetical protein